MVDEKRQRIKLYQAEYRAKNKDRIAAQRSEAFQARKSQKRDQMRHRYATDEVYAAQMRERARAYRKAKPNCHRRATLRKFGLSLEDYDGMIKAQNGTCAICSLPQTHRLLNVDHNHSTGKVRGLLCDKCNHGLGLFKDDVNRLASAIQYLGAT